MQPAELVFSFGLEYLTKAKSVIKEVAFQETVSILSTHRIWTTGMGKAGLIAKKLAVTLSCNSRPAAFIHAGEALHGDFGSIQTGDVLVAFSNSGMTDEILRVVTKAKLINAYVVLITGNANSELAKLSHSVICYGLVKEACPLGLTPTTSVLVMLAIADALAMEVQQMVGLTYDDYARNHHAGYLGQVAKERARS